MADITPSQAVVLEGKTKEIAIGEAVTAVGSVLYLTGNEGFLADADKTSVEARFYGLAVETGILDATITILQYGRVNVGAVLTQGVVYVLSKTADAGKMAPLADITVTGDFITLVGIAETSSILVVQPWSTGIVIP